METTKHTYEFGYDSNSYFNGRDAVITRDDGKRIKINSYDGHMAVCVKDYSFGLRDSAPEDVKRMVEELPDRPDPHWDGMVSYDRWAYELACQHFWHDAEWLCTDDPEAPMWATGVHSAGRSGGWCVIEGTDDIVANGFPTGEWTEQEQARLDQLEAIYNDTATSADEWDELREEHDELIERRDIYTKRNEFLALAFDIVGCIDGAHEYLEELVREEHAELEARRADNTVLSDN